MRNRKYTQERWHTMVNDYSDMKKQIDRQLKKYGNVQSLMRYINEDNLYIKHLQQDGNKATGIDKVSKDEYNANIKDNLENLINKMKSNKYYPNAVRRAMIQSQMAKKDR